MDFGLESGNDELARQLTIDYRSAALVPADRALCDWAVKLTLSPGAMTDADIEHLRSHDLTDEAISIAAQVVSYFNYINRIADGLGVDPEDAMTPSHQTWTTTRATNWSP